jgi:transposase
MTQATRFFLEARHPRQRQYEALRAFFVEGLKTREIARRFGYSHGSLRNLISLFRREVSSETGDEFFRAIERGPQAQPKKSAARDRVISLRKRNLSVYDIHDLLRREGKAPLSVTAIQEILKEAGFARLPRRGDDERPDSLRPTADAIADVRSLSLASRTFTTHAGGLFLLLPLIVQVDLDQIATATKLPGSKMIPATHALRSALILKMIGRTRRSHVMDLVLDEGVALAAGLNAIPKATYMAQYSSSLGRKKIADVLGHWMDRLRKASLIDTSSFNLDFHSISYFGADEVVEKHYVPRRSQRRKAVLTFFAQDAEGQLFCYSNADIRKGEEAGEVLAFVKFWEKRYGERPKLLVFDSKLTTQPNLLKLNELGIKFITLRRRSKALKQEISDQPPARWRTVHLAELPHRKYRKPRVIDQKITTLKGYPLPIRQMFITDLGHDEPTILLTNDLESTTKAVIMRYAKRMLIENGLADAIDFFHLDSLSSAVALNVDFDVLLTVIASGIYRMFATKIHGFEKAQARQLFRRFLDSTARVKITPSEVLVSLTRRAHNPLLIDAGYIDTPVIVPWWGGRRLRIVIR